MKRNIKVNLEPCATLACNAIRSDNPRVYVNTYDGYLEFNFTSEGLIIEHWYENQASEEANDTFSMTYEEIISDLLEQ
jgi:hypothetical protein